MTTAYDWYKSFYKAANSDKAFQKKYKTDREYTEAVGIFLNAMATTLGYSVLSERKSIGGGRLDHVWRKGDDEITIEHENNHKSIAREVSNLCEHRSGLKVLITYVPDANYSATAYEKAKEVETQLCQEAGFKNEFLLIIGGYDEDGWANDWAAFRCIRQIRMESLKG
jgi:hypothetical protein